MNCDLHHLSLKDILSLISLSIVLLVSSSASAQLLPENLRFKEIGLQQGLSQIAVLTVAQDQQGFVWFGTVEGLNRYDGMEIKVYKHNATDTTSISANYIFHICPSAKGGLWLGTTKGLSYYDPSSDKFTRWHHEENNPNSLPSDFIYKTLEDRDGNLWIATFRDGLAKLNTTTGVITSWNTDTSPLQSNRITELLEDKSGRIWIGTPKGLTIYDPSTTAFFAKKQSSFGLK